MKNIFWSATSNEERTIAIHKIQSIVSKYGDLVDFKLFSDISISMVIEIKESNIDQLWNALNERIMLDKHEYLHSDSLMGRTIYLNLSFAKGTGNLSIDNPSVPG